MANFLENILDSMSSAFNSNTSITNGSIQNSVDLSEDKTLKWRSLHNNQYARRYSKKNDRNGKGTDHRQSQEATTFDIDKNDVLLEQKDKKNASELKETTKNTGRRVTRSRTDYSNGVTPSYESSQRSPITKRGRLKRNGPPPTNQQQADEGSSPEKVILERESIKKPRRSERNSDMKIEDDSIEESNPIQNSTAKTSDTDEKKLKENVKIKKTRRSVRLESKVHSEDNNSPKKLINTQLVETDVKLEIDKQQQQQQIIDKIIDNKQTDTTIIVKAKKRGRKKKTQIDTEMQKSIMNSFKDLSHLFVPSSYDSKSASVQDIKTVLTSQRPLRRIKPTVKILENEELRYEFESKNVARMTAYNNDIKVDNDDNKCKKTSTDSSVDNTQVTLNAIENRLNRQLTSNLNVDNIYPNGIQKIGIDLNVFLNEVKIANINLQRSPETKKLNKKQYRRLLKQKEKHFEKLGLRRVVSDVSDSINSSSDNDEFLPSTKINVDNRSRVTLRLRNNKETNVINNIQNECIPIPTPSSPQICETKTTEIDGITIIDKKDNLNIGTINCLCNKQSKYYTQNNSDTFCCAIDDIDEQRIGCCNKINGELVNLLRPSTKVGYMILCEHHKSRLKAHNCCAICGIFCTEGIFSICKQKHFFHLCCARNIALKNSYSPSRESEYSDSTFELRCPHCGEETPNATSAVIMRTKSIPVFVPNQHSLVKPAKMCVSEGGKVSSIKDRPLTARLALENLIPESVVNIIVRERSHHPNEFSSQDMFYSVKNDDLERVAEILASDYEMSSTMGELFSGTCLHLAAHFGTVQMVYLLLCKNSSQQFLNTTDKELRTALMCSVIAGKYDVLQLFIQCGADVTPKGPDGMTCLHMAAKLGRIPAMNLILESYKNSTSITSFKAFINAADDGGWTAMVWAAENGHTELVSMLINHGADPNICDSENNTVLHWASLSDRIDTFLVTLGAHVDCSIQNINGDTPLHISCRQQSTPICLILIAHGADLMVKNKAGEIPYDCIPEKSSQCAKSVGFNMQMSSYFPNGKRNRILCGDISNGREAHPIQMIKAICRDTHIVDFMDDMILPDFKYITKSIILQNSVQIDKRISQMRVCSCNDGCISDDCQCCTISVQNWYTPEGRLIGEFNYEDPAMIFECNDVCGCNKLLCKNRVVQNGLKIPLQVFECTDPTKGWGVRALIQIPIGTFISEYVGEILTDQEADRRTDDSYFFDLGASDHCIDANYYGNVSRFFNHSCLPNIVPVRVYYEHQDFRFPKIAFFANQTIPAGDELVFDYGEKFWAVKQNYFTCKCLKSCCRYSRKRENNNN